MLLCVVVVCCNCFISKIITKIEGGGRGERPSPGTPSPDRPKFSIFFPSPATFFIRSSLSEVFPLNFGGVFEAPEPCNVHVWALVLSCETPAASDAGASGHGNKPSTSPPKSSISPQQDSDETELASPSRSTQVNGLGLWQRHASKWN